MDMCTKSFIGLVLSILLLTTGCKTIQREEIEKPAVGIRILRISNSDYLSPLHTTGKLSTKTESKLSFKTGGILHLIFDTIKVLQSDILRQQKNFTKQPKLPIKKGTLQPLLTLYLVLVS